MPQGGNGGGPAKGLNKILGNWKDDLLVGTVWVESGGQRVGQAISARRPTDCN